MKTLTRLGTVGALTVFSISLVAAQEPNSEAKHLCKARELIGMNVKNQQDETIGEVKDLVIDLPDGRVVYAVLGSADLFGSRDKLAAVPPQALIRSSDEKHLVLAMDREKFKSAPSFESREWPNLSDRAWGKQVYGYYAQQPYWESPLSRDALKAMDKMRKASEILGIRVENPQNEKLGEIQDLVTDLQAGRIVYAVLASGGFLGIGEKYLALPPGAFGAPTDEKELVLNVDKERLKAAPGFDKDSWPSMADRTWGRQVYTYYGQEPYWETDRSQAQAADNTRRNARDRKGDTLTPEDQGSSESDRTLTQQIRREIQKEDTFSTNAKNVKVITVNGAVTLRGVVNSQQEKDQLEAKAKQVAGVTRVDNQLEVRR